MHYSSNEYITTVRFIDNTSEEIGFSFDGTKCEITTHFINHNGKIHVNSLDSFRNMLNYEYISYPHRVTGFYARSIILGCFRELTDMVEMFAKNSLPTKACRN
jgi:hypothetical protein